MKRRRLRSVNEVLKEIKAIDPDTAVTRYMISNLINSHKIYNQKVGNKLLVDYDEILDVLGLAYEWIKIA